MKCRRCSKNNSPGAVYCAWCGGQLRHETEVPCEPVSQMDEIQQVEKCPRSASLQASRLEQHAEAICREIFLEESELRPESPVPETQPGEPEARVRVAPVSSSADPMRRSGLRAEKSQAMPGPAEPISLQPYREPERTERPRRGLESSRGARWFQDWEQALPGNWLSRIGVVALFIGLGFLAKLAYDEGWIRPVFQLLIGLSIGLVLLWGGQHWNGRYRVWAQALTGGGVAVLYLSFFASYALHGLMPFLATFVLMFFVTVGAVAIALRQNSMAIAIIGIAGAFLVPIILGASDYSDPAGGSGGHSPGLLIAYILLLDAGIVWLSTLRNWRWFTLLGFVGSLLVYGLWYVESGHEESLLMTLGGLTGIFLCFAAATTLFHVVWRRIPELTDLALMSLNAAVYFGVSYILMWDEYRGWLGTFSLLLSGFYGLLGYLALRRSEGNSTLFHFAVGIAIVFLTIAIPMQFHRAWITVAWAAEGAVLTWIAARQSIPRLQLWALGAFGLVLVRLFAFDNVVNQASFRPVLDDDRFLPFAMSIVGFYAAAFFMRRDPKVLQPWFFPMMVLVGSFLTVWLLSAEIVDFVGRRIIEARLDQSGGLQIRNLESARALALSMTWTAYGLCLVAVGVCKKWGWLRIGGYVLVAAAVGMTVVLLNHVYAGIHRANSMPIMNYSFGGFAVSVCGLYLLSYIIAKNRGSLHSAETGMFPVLVIGANLLSVWAMSAEVITFLGHMENARSLVLVSLWAAYGLCLVAVGVWRSWSWLRIGAYALVAAAIGMAIVSLNHTHAEIHRVNSTPILNYSFGGFVLSVIALYILAHLVARNLSKLHPAERGLLPLLLISASVLSLWAMSSEVLTYISSGYGKSMGLTLLWASYSFVLIVVGILRKWRSVRVGGLALLGVAIMKLFIVDTFTLESGYRVAAYLTLGVLLLAGGFVYHRYAEVIKGFISNQPPR